jgi:hypothetical protein
MERLDSSEFTWELWRAGSIHDLGIPCRKAWILSPYGRSILLKFIVGWCESERLAFRPKVDEVAVMIEKDGERFWFHLRDREFKELTKENICLLEKC